MFGLKNIFSIRNLDAKNKIIKIFGKDIKFRYSRKVNKYDIECLADISQKNIIVALLHREIFPKYKNIYQGRDIVVCGAGPSLSNYIPIKGAIHIALNRAFMFDKVKFDYIFAQDWRAIYHITDKLREYKGNNCIKFIGRQDGIKELEIPATFKNTFIHEDFITDIYRKNLINKSKFAVNLNFEPLGNFSTIAFPAMQFALWTNPRKIYLVGCDSAPVGHYDKVVLESNKDALTNGVYGKIVKEWIEFKQFAAIYYPDIEIISINPVGLKGIFEDIYME